MVQTATFQNVQKTGDIAFGIGFGVGKAVPDSGLGSQIYDTIKMMYPE